MGNSLKGKVAVITGAGSGMGLSTAKLFHAEGASVMLTDVSGNEQTIAKELGDRAVAMTADVSRATEIEPVIAGAVDAFGGLDILCNIAGIPGALVALTETTEESFDQLINVNLRGVFLTMRAAIPHMIARGGGAIVNVASTAALIGTPSLSAYAASKAGVVAFTKVAAVEYGKQNIRVNAVCPGVIETPMFTAGVAENPGLVDYLRELTPMGRIGQPEEIATTVLFLASSASSYITGSVLPVEGGQVTA